MIQPADIARVRNIPLGDVVSQTVMIRRRAAGSLWALCPFHNEKSPSFKVDIEGNYFKCHGCQAKGDVIAFYQKLHGKSFGDSIKALAEEHGIELGKTRNLSQHERAAAEQEGREAYYFWQMVERQIVDLLNDLYRCQRQAEAFLAAVRRRHEAKFADGDEYVPYVPTPRVRFAQLWVAWLGDSLTDALEDSLAILRDSPVLDRIRIYREVVTPRLRRRLRLRIQEDMMFSEALIRAAKCEVRSA